MSFLKGFFIEIDEEILLIGGGDELIGSVILTLHTDTMLLVFETTEGELRSGGSCRPLPAEAGLVSKEGLWNCKSGVESRDLELELSRDVTLS